jgi:hypothetical protein
MKKITLSDGNTPIDTIDVKPSGDWEYSYGNLTLKTYSLTAKAEYGSEPVSAPPRAFTVAAFISPSITVTDSRGPLRQNETTYDSTVALLGQATPKEQIQVTTKVQLSARPSLSVSIGNGARLSQG